MARQISAFWALALFLLIAQNIVLAKSAGCGKTPTLTSGKKTMTINEKNREWILKIPNNYNKDRPHKLIFGLHWLLANYNDVSNGHSGILGQNVEPYFGLERHANGSAIFISPNGLNLGWANRGGEDITFIDNIIKTVEADLCIDENLRFSTGFSYGGAMSFSLACSRPKIFRAVAVISGSLLSGCAGGKDPVPYLGIHGGSDSILPYRGGIMIRDQFVKANGCKAVDTPAPKGSRQSIKTVFEGCSKESPLWWIAHDGDHTPTPRDSKGFFAPEETWKFFSQFF